MREISTIADLLVGESAVLESVNQHSPLCSKLTQMGFLPNKTIELIRTSWNKDTFYLQIGVQYMALRREEAAQLFICNVSSPATSSPSKP